MLKTTNRLLTFIAILLLCHNLSTAQTPTPLAANGRLKVINKQLCNETGNAIQLRGMSTHGLQWFGSCHTANAAQTVAKDWGCDVFRAAMYIDEGGYLNNKTGIKTQVENITDWSAQAGMYCIIDWHILNPGDPNLHTADAIEFFRAQAQRNAGKKHVIYELCNEPNGVSWSSIKSYAEQIIPVIRQYDPEAIILVGTPNWSGTPGDVSNNPLTGANAYNVMYTFHFYAGSHYSQNYIDGVIKTVPLFISEWGTSNYSGNGGNDYVNAQKWMDLFAGSNTSGLKISWCNWSFCDKGETSAALNVGACGNAAWNNTSESGTWVKNHILSPADSWTGTAPTNQTPSVFFTAPANNALYNAPASITFTTTATDPDGTVSKVEYYNGTTLLGSATTAPYTFIWSNVAVGTYSIIAKATDNSNAVGNSMALQVVVNSVTNTGEDLIGVNCVRTNGVAVFELSAANRVNATNYSWWCNGSTQSIVPLAGQPWKATYSFGKWFTGGNVCVGVNYSQSPWYKQVCKNVTLCSVRSANLLVPKNMSYPNPTTNVFNFMVSKDVQIVQVIDYTGRERLIFEELKEGQTLTFGEELPQGMYFLHIRYVDEERQLFTLIKTK